MKILVVEDEIRIANSLKKGFMEESFDVEICNNGEEGLKQALDKEYDCIVLDLMLPKMSGLVVLQTLRAKKITTPVIILTAKGEVSDRVEGLEVGADDYLVKPFSFEELLARVKAVVRRTSMNGEILEVGSLKLDPKSKLVHRAGKEIILSAREFKILEFLMSQNGAIISEQRIINYIWNYDADISSNVVAAHIKNLRSKVDKNFADEKPLIRTIRGLGYRIEP